MTDKLLAEKHAGCLLLLSYRCFVTVNVMWLFLMVPCVGLQCVIVVYPDHTHLLFSKLKGCCTSLNEQSICLSIQYLESIGKTRHNSSIKSSLGCT